MFALLAQLDRAPDYESGGWGFDSLTVYHSVFFRKLGALGIVERRHCFKQHELAIVQIIESYAVDRDRIALSFRFLLQGLEIEFLLVGNLRKHVEHGLQSCLEFVVRVDNGPRTLG